MNLIMSAVIAFVLQIIFVSFLFVADNTLIIIFFVVALILIFTTLISKTLRALKTKVLAFSFGWLITLVIGFLLKLPTQIYYLFYQTEPSAGSGGFALFIVLPSWVILFLIGICIAALISNNIQNGLRSGLSKIENELKKEQAKRIVDCFKEEDTDGLSAMFGKNPEITSELSFQIQMAFEVIEDIIGYDVEPRCHNEHTDEYIIKTITSDSEKQYEFYIKADIKTRELVNIWIHYTVDGAQRHMFIGNNPFLS